MEEVHLKKITQRLNSKQFTTRYHSRAFLLLWGILFPGYNDFLFRRAMFRTDYSARKKSLVELKQNYEKYLSTGVSSAFDEKWLSLRRDKILLTKNKSCISKELTFEADYLPRVQIPKEHEKYSLLVEYAKISGNDPEANIKDLFNSLYDKVTVNKHLDNFACSSEIYLNKEILGVPFLTEEDKHSNDFVSFIEKAYAMLKISQELPKKMWGLRALGFIPPDSRLLDTTNQAYEAEILGEIDAIEAKLNPKFANALTN